MRTITPPVVAAFAALLFIPAAFSEPYQIDEIQAESRIYQPPRLFTIDQIRDAVKLYCGEEVEQPPAKAVKGQPRFAVSTRPYPFDKTEMRIDGEDFLDVRVFVEATASNATPATHPCEGCSKIIGQPLMLQLDAYERLLDGSPCEDCGVLLLPEPERFAVVRFYFTETIYRNRETDEKHSIRKDKFEVLGVYSEEDFYGKSGAFKAECDRREGRAEWRDEMKRKRQERIEARKRMETEKGKDEFTSLPH